ncbi:MAG: YggS family pyridoxal phosphate-dependent enzyme [Bacteroidales bacterium]
MINREALHKIKSDLPPNTKLVAVSKFKPAETILEAYNEGQRDFGENRPQELSSKMEVLPSDIRWHFIGHLQTNKIKYIIDKVFLIHSVDSVKLLEEINKEAVKRNLTVNCLLQVYIAKEETKQGLSETELIEIVKSKESFRGVRICGLMGMASFTEDKEEVKREFSYLSDLFNNLKRNYFRNDPYFHEISMGMSGDYDIAIEFGATLVRIGSLIFGER